MTKQEFMAASLPHGLKCITHHTSNEVKRIIGASFGNRILFRVSYENQIDYPLPFEMILPIIRPLDSLTKECVQADYNEGNPFVPIVELAKMAFPKYACFLSDSSDSINKFVSVDTDYDYFRFSFDGFNFSYNGYGGYISNQLQLFQQLLKWHFWLNKPEGEEVIYATEEFNPYK
jgi:hypothetical protein